MSENIFKNTYWMIIDKLVSVFLLTLVNFFIIRTLGPELFGTLSYAQSFVALFLSISLFGLEVVTTKLLVNSDMAHKANVIVNSLYIRLIASFTSCVLINLTSFIYIQDEYTRKIIFILSISLIFNMSDIFLYYFNSLSLSSKIIPYKITVTIIVNAMKVGLIYSSPNVLTLSSLIVLESMLVMIAYASVFRSEKIINGFNFDINKKLIRNIATEAWPLILSGAIVTAYMKMDQIMIDYFLNKERVGVYAAAVKISEAWFFIPIAVASSTYPIIIKSKKNPDLYEEKMKILYSCNIWLSMFVFLFFFFTSDFIINLVFGSEFNDSVNVLKILAFAGVMVSIGVTNTNWLMSQGLQKINLINKIIGLMFNFFLNYKLIPKYGINGAAISTVISYTISNFLVLLSNSKTRVSFFMILKSLDVRLIYKIKELKK
ncbi:flippase [Vibrio parahaemolyticus]